MFSVVYICLFVHSKRDGSQVTITHNLNKGIPLHCPRAYDLTVQGLLASAAPDNILKVGSLFRDPPWTCLNLLLMQQVRLVSRRLHPTRMVSYTHSYPDVCSFYFRIKDFFWLLH